MLKSGEKLRKLLMLLTTWGLLLASFAAYERYFVMGQQEFLKEDGFRVLTTLSGELIAQIQKVQKSAEASIKLAAPDQKQDPLEQEAVLRDFLRLYVIKDAPISRETLQDIKTCSLQNRENMGSPPIEITQGSDPLTLSISCHNPPRLLYTLDLVEDASNAFAQQSGHFDDVLVVDSTGSVIIQKSATGADSSLSKSSTKPRITNLKSLLTGNATAEPRGPERNESDSAKGTKKASADSGGTAVKKAQTANNAGKEEEPDLALRGDGSFNRLIGASAFTEVTAAGKKYEMFSRPVPIALPGGKTWNLVVIGLWDANEFEKSSREFPYSALIWAALIVVALLSLSWPLFKLRFMSNTERFTATDGWYLVLALFLASTSIMLMLLNASYNAHEKDKSDRDMEKLAKLIKSNFLDEINHAVSQLDRLSVPSTSLQGDFLIQEDFLKGSAGFPVSSNEFPYPYFDSAFWAKGDGSQRYKVDVRLAPGPLINVGSRPYFKRAISAKGQDVKDHYLQPILTRSTGEFEVDLARLFLHEDEEQLRIEVLSLRPMSLVDPVLPPGYRFAVIDANCNVLFHSDLYRNMREDFCEDSKDKHELKPWLFSGVDTALDISYEGNAERGYLTSLESPHFALEGNNADSYTTQAFLLVFRKPEVALTLNLAIILVCSVLMGTYFVVLLLVAVGYLMARRALRWVYMPRFLFPQRRNAFAYLQILIANILIILLFWWFYPKLYEAPLLALTVAVAVLSMLLTLSKLAFPDWGPLAVGILAAATLLASWLAIPSPEPKDPRDWEYVWYLLGAACLIATLLTGKVAAVLTRKALSWVRPASNLLEKHFGKAYVFAVLSMITATGLIPCIGFFKYSYDAITELAVKRDELELSERLIHREDRIRAYYNPYYNRVKLPQKLEEPLVTRRIGELWDRYDSGRVPGQGFFDVNKETSASNQGENPSEEMKLTRDDLNEGIERVIANAILSLTLPTNALGGQMSRLEIASTKNAANNWEHCWTEPLPTTFHLFWKSNSRWPLQSVSATYPDWEGLGLWPRICLVLLWVGLGFWLVIVLKEIFLTHVEDAMRFETVDWTGVADIQQNILVIVQAEAGHKVWTQITDLPRANRLDLRTELKKMVEDKSYSPGWDRTVNILILDYFDFSINDNKYNQARLNLVESLLCYLDLKVVIISTIDPLYSLTDDATGAFSDGTDSAVKRRPLGRWASALGKFKKVHLKDQSQPEFENIFQAFTVNGDFALRVKGECDHTAKLREIGKMVLKEFSGDRSLSREWVTRRVLDLADSYYHVLWTGLSTTERLVLYQLARDGWANPKNVAAIRQLEAKQLVTRDPMYKIINESFRLFVLSPEHAEDIAQWQKLEQQSTWHALKFIVIAVGIGFGAWLLHTQAAFSQTVVGSIAAIATLLTAAGSFFSRSGRPTPAKDEGE